MYHTCPQEEALPRMTLMQNPIDESIQAAHMSKIK